MVERFEAPYLMTYGFKQNPLPSKNGHWVRHSDYAELEAENARLEKANRWWEAKAEDLSRTGAVKGQSE